MTQTILRGGKVEQTRSAMLALHDRFLFVIQLDRGVAMVKLPIRTL